MEQPVDPAKVDKGAEVRDVLDRAFAHLSLVQFGKDFFPKLVAVLFQMTLRETTMFLRALFSLITRNL